MQETGIKHFLLKKELEDWKGVGGKHFFIIYPLCHLGGVPISTHYFRGKILCLQSHPPHWLTIWEKNLFSKKEVYVTFGFLLLFLLAIFPWPHSYISNIQEGGDRPGEKCDYIFPVRITHGTGMFWKLVTTRYQTLC